MCNSVGIDKESRKNFHTKIIDWWKDNKRDLPWRDPEITPYEVMVSEFMLQQTQVNRVIPMILNLTKIKFLPFGLSQPDVAIILDKICLECCTSRKAAFQILELGYFPSYPTELIPFLPLMQI